LIEQCEPAMADHAAHTATTVLPPVRSWLCRHAALALSASAVGVTIAAGLLMALVVARSGRPDWPAFKAASEIAAIVAIASTIPVAACVQRGLMVAVVGYFISAAVRVVGVVVGILVAAYVGQVPVVHTIILVMIYYAALLVVELLVLALVLWDRTA